MVDGWVDKCVHFGIHVDSKPRSGHTKTIDERIQCVGGAPTLPLVHPVYMGKVGFPLNVHCFILPCFL